MLNGGTKRDIGITLRGLTYSEALHVTTEADRHGIHSVWLPESPGDPDVHSWLAALAAATGSIKVAPGVAAAPLRHPLQQLMAASAIADSSGGRFIIGLGSGNRFSLSRLDIETRPPIGYLREYLEICRLGLAASPIDYEGKYFKVNGAPVHQTEHQVPIVVAAHNPMMLDLAGRVADGVLLNMISVNEVMRATDFVKSANRTVGGRAVIAAYILTCISEDKAEAEFAARKALSSFCSSEIFRTRLRNLDSPFAEMAEAIAAAAKQLGLTAAAKKMPDEMLHSLAIAGDATLIDRRLGEYRSAGVDLPILSIYPAPLVLAKPFPPVPASGVYDATLAVIDAIKGSLER